MILGSYRDTELHARHELRVMVSELRRERLMDRISVPRLTLHETAALVATELGGAAIAGELSEELQRATEGNPFFTLEVLRLLHQRGDLILQGERWRRREPGALEAPETVREAIRERVERLSPSTQAALEAASVLGQVFAYASLRRMGDQMSAELTQLGEALDEAFLAGFIQETQQDGSRNATYCFSHALAQRAIYAAIPTPRRRRLHLAAGVALEETPPHQRAAQAALVASHFLEGDAIARALPYVLDAAQRAAHLFAWNEAERQYQLAVELARELGDRAREMDALDRRGETLTLMGRHDEALVTFEAANALHREAGNLDRLAWNVAYMTRSYSSSGHVEEGFAQLTALLSSLAAIAGEDRMDRPDGQPPAKSLTAAPQPMPGPFSLEALQTLAAQATALLSPHPAARVYHSLTVYHVFMGRADEAVALGEQAVARARAAGNADTFLRAEAFYGLSLAAMGYITEAVAAFKEARATAEQVGDPEAFFLASGNLGEIYRLRGELDLAARETDLSLAAAERSRIPDMIIQAWSASGLIAWCAGKWDDARQRYARAEEFARESGDPTPYGVWIFQGALLLAEGRTQQAHTLLKDVIAQAERVHDLSSLRMAHAALAEEELLRKQPDAASQRLEGLLEAPGTEGIEAAPLTPLFAWALGEMGDTEQAQIVMNQAITRLTAQKLHSMLVDALRVQALLAMRQERWRDAEEALEQSLMLARRIPLPYAEAKTLYAQGLLDHQRGAPAQARQRFNDALRILNQLGERLYAEQVEQALTAFHD